MARVYGFSAQVAREVGSTYGLMNSALHGCDVSFDFTEGDLCYQWRDAKRTVTAETAEDAVIEVMVGVIGAKGNITNPSSDDPKVMGLLERAMNALPKLKGLNPKAAETRAAIRAAIGA